MKKIDIMMQNKKGHLESFRLFRLPLRQAIQLSRSLDLQKEAAGMNLFEFSL